MPRATWNGEVIADCEATRVVEGNHYFPRASLKEEFFQPSETQTECGWKGTAEYYHLSVGRQTNEDAAWSYRDPKPEASHIADCVAFSKGVKVESNHVET